MGSPSSWAAARFASSAARSPPSARAFSVAVATTAFSSASMRTRVTRPPSASMRARSSSAARYTAVSWDSSAGLTMPGPRPLLRVEAGVYRRAVRGVSAALGRGQHLEGVALRPGRLVFLNQPGLLHLRHHPPGGERVAVKMLFGQVCVGHGSIEPHVGDCRAGPLGAGAPGPVARVGLLRAGGVFPPMAGPLVAVPVPAVGWWVVMAWRAWSRTWSSGARAARPGLGVRGAGVGVSSRNRSSRSNMATA